METKLLIEVTILDCEAKTLQNRLKELRQEIADKEKLLFQVEEELSNKRKQLGNQRNSSQS